MTDLNNLILPNQAGVAGQFNMNNMNTYNRIRSQRPKGLEPISEELELGSFGQKRDDKVDFNFETKDSGLNDRLDLFIGDVDLYTSMLI